MSTSCNTTECQLKFVEYKNSIDKLLKRLRDSEQQKGEYEIYNLTLKHKLKRPAKTESKHFEKLFEYIDTLIHNYFGKEEINQSIRDTFLGMIDSIWSLLAARYSDPDSWLDLKYIGTNLVERLTTYKHQATVEAEKQSNEHIYETLSELKAANRQKKIPDTSNDLEFNKVNIVELNHEIEFLKKQSKVLNKKLVEQNCFIKNLIGSFQHNLKAEKRDANNSSTSSGRLSTCSNEVSSESINFNSSQVTTGTLSSSCPSDRNAEGRGSVRNLMGSNKDFSTFTCPHCKIPIDSNRCPIEKFERHVQACKDTNINEHLKENIDSKTSRWYSSGTSMASNSSSSGNMHMASQQRVKHDSINNNRDSKNYLIIQNFEPKPRKRL